LDTIGSPGPNIRVPASEDFKGIKYCLRGSFAGFLVRVFDGHLYQSVEGG
jgi:hypothetical protein